MAESFEGLMDPEREKTLGVKLKFKNKIAELVDDPLIRIIDNKLLEPLAKKLPPDVREVVSAALGEVIDEMEPIEI